ncbi:short neuropeptide F [Achroia grisella]|uniref:short neuropeptide F n=1 Tax=Achroia grisella TaxID=688607 RepID=UPI0027D30FA5|nr:short neuropeptide F [Achroia grisella]
MSRSCAIVLALCGFAAITTLPVSKAQGLSSQYDTSAAAAESQSGWDALGGLYALLAQHDALGGHALARKSVRSPSRRLRFGRRSDPDMPPQAPLDEMDELLSLRDVRTPVRLRFGRRSDERAVPHIFPQEEQDRDVRAPSMRLRFGRRSDNNMFLMPYEPAVPKEVKANGSVEDDRQQY